MAHRTCCTCKQAKRLSQFSRCGGGHQAACKSCQADYRISRRAKRRAQGLESYEAISHRRLRVRVLLHYGGSSPSCACCGEQRYEFLAVDHINGNGRQHRQEILAKHGQHLYRWLIHQNFPPGFRVLCHNCNSAIGYFGYCPHALEREGKQGHAIVLDPAYLQPHLQRDAILQALRGGAQSPSAVATLIGSTQGRVRRLLCIYRDKGLVVHLKRGAWAPAA